MFKNKAFSIFCFIFGLIVFAPSLSYAACSSPAGNEGDQMYNLNFKVMQFCDNTDWRSMDCSGVGTGGCAAPTDCANIGDLCTDGSQFAGFKLDGDSCFVIYVTDDNQSAAIAYSGVSVVTGADDIEDGQANQAVIVANETLSDYPALELCENLSRHSQTDWYLPARDELHLLYKNRAAIDTNAAGNFTAFGYWSSTEDGTSTAWNHEFGNGQESAGTKTITLDVRCVRSGGTFVADPCLGTPAPGAVCGDGSVYAGVSPAGGDMYVPRCDAGMSWDGANCINPRSTINWNDGNMDFIDTTLVNCGSVPACDPDGEANTATLITEDSNSVAGGQQPHAAAQYCADLSLHGQTDWYLPSAPELNVMFLNEVAIGEFEETGTYYWSSSENDINDAWRQRFSDGNQDQFFGKNSVDNVVRCARR